jgi:hypothetical protein
MFICMGGLSLILYVIYIFSPVALLNYSDELLDNEIMLIMIV